MATTKISLKLLIHTKANKVLFAEDFVDFLFFLLSLSVGFVIKLLTGRSTIGCIGNVYSSFANLNEAYTQPNLQKAILLNPKSSTSIANISLLMTASEASSTTRDFYVCTSCSSHLTNQCGFLCPSCRRSSMTRKVSCVGNDPENANKAQMGYVQTVISYMITNDLEVTPMFMISSISIMNKFYISQFDVLEDREVEFGTDEALDLLTASFHSGATLTAVFLKKKVAVLMFLRQKVAVLISALGFL